jgi:putative ubiquitin-RnfH superfamily antitoxin RatB of RatAB toxin-antitoxin module
MTEEIDVEVVYALPGLQTLLELKVATGTTALQAIERSGILEQHPEISLDKNKIGIFGKLVKQDTILRGNDRVEIYRALVADPKEVRRKRAEEGKAMKKGGGDL